ncbi:sarcosine oxidase subunit delta family protein [Arthrobacter frigidicola]|nr:sarcosine oxidase subunit delta family protein [Arthrobacter frigidicola]
MLLIPCPHCGPRDETEFHYGGQAHVPYPGNPNELDDRQWAEFLFYRENPKGAFAERWLHSTGCRQWFNMVRDTATYDIQAVYRMGEPRPTTTPPGGGSRATGGPTGPSAAHAGTPASPEGARP